MISILVKRLLGRLFDLACNHWRRGLRRPIPVAVQEIRVELLPEVQQQLRQLTASNGLSRTDNTNRAITVYEFLDRMIGSGHDILLRSRRRWWQIFSPRYSYQKVVFRTPE